uniref:Photolyase/cryptochrome alpha/beta domain-containing protein n=1 Tax=Emiliania huxleyi TaxID=2903 RepID=A0A7S3TGS8_EMIHU
MGRDQRVQDNWALLHAAELAEAHSLPLSVVFCLPPPAAGSPSTGPGSTLREYGFMLKGLREVSTELAALRVPFCLLHGGSPPELLSQFCAQHEVAVVVADYSPLREPRGWKEALIAARPATPVLEVDAHNVVPVWVASDKREVGARTIRKKITEKLPQWLVDIPALPPRAAADPQPPAGLAAAAAAMDWVALEAGLQLDRAVAEVDWCKPGAAAAPSLSTRAHDPTRLHPHILQAPPRRSPPSTRFATSGSSCLPTSATTRTSPRARICLRTSTLGSSPRSGWRYASSSTPRRGPTASPLSWRSRSFGASSRTTSATTRLWEAPTTTPLGLAAAPRTWPPPFAPPKSLSPRPLPSHSPPMIRSTVQRAGRERALSCTRRTSASTCTLSNSWRGRRRTRICGTPRSGSSQRAARCTASCACIGQRRFSSGPLRRPR